MITIIHGDNISASRKYFIEQKEKYPDVQVFEGEKITLIDLAQIFEGGELFSNTKTVFIEQFFTKRKKSQEKDTLVNSLQKYADENNLFLWEGKELEKNFVNSLKNANFKIFKFPQALFLLLDSLKPGRGKDLIVLLHQTLETTDVEMVFFMLVRQIRLLLAVSDSSKEQIDELKRLALWQRTKLQQQASMFSFEQLSSLYGKFFQLEIAQKKGRLPSNLVSLIDFLLLEI